MIEAGRLSQHRFSSRSLFFVAQHHPHPATMSDFSMETCPSSAAFFGFMGVASSMVFGSKLCAEGFVVVSKKSKKKAIRCGVVEREIGRQGWHHATRPCRQAPLCYLGVDALPVLVVQLHLCRQCHARAESGACRCIGVRKFRVDKKSEPPNWCSVPLRVEGLGCSRWAAVPSHVKQALCCRCSSCLACVWVGLLLWLMHGSGYTVVANRRRGYRCIRTV